MQNLETVFLHYLIDLSKASPMSSIAFFELFESEFLMWFCDQAGGVWSPENLRTFAAATPFEAFEVISYSAPEFVAPRSSPSL